ncbi:MAG TPA: ubiquinol-cytochrome c reductase iron-sulfur subunit [Parvularculaceae bacterium]|nr:ubiquinol-cytochrome c reductase iron-sulfur subunit [Parvularculaceae bacterium]
MSATSDSHGGHAGEGEPTRRDFIHIFSASVAAVGAIGAIIPLIGQMSPDATVLALSTKEVDLSGVPVGQAIKVVWRGVPVFIRHRTKEEIEKAESVPLGALKDPMARNDNLPAKTDAEDKNRVIKPEWLVVVGICTHLGCVPLGTAQGENRGDYDGWFCPCHGSQYDLAGRIRKGPAPENLLVPPYKFLTDTSIKIG